MALSGVVNFPQPSLVPYRKTLIFHQSFIGVLSHFHHHQRRPKPTNFSAPPNFKPPQPKRFAVRPDKIFDVLGASLALLFRLGTGVFVSGYSASFVSKNEIPPGLTVKETSNLGPRPEKPIEIYEFEGCSLCRKIKHAVTNQVVMDSLRQVDPNTGVAMYELDEIIMYLAGKYGDGSVPIFLSLGLLTTLSAGFAMIGRAGKGSIYTPAKLPPKPLEIWAYEPSPFCKVVREVLVELELPHILRCYAVIKTGPSY